MATTADGQVIATLEALQGRELTVIDYEELVDLLIERIWVEDDGRLTFEGVIPWQVTNSSSSR